MSKIIPPEKARQGGKGRQVLMVLIGGLVLAFIVWGLVEIYGSAISPTDVDKQTTAPDTQNTTPDTQTSTPATGAPATQTPAQNN